MLLDSSHGVHLRCPSAAQNDARPLPADRSRPSAWRCHLPGSFRPCRFSRLRRFTPSTAPRVYCAPLTAVGFALLQDWTVRLLSVVSQFHSRKRNTLRSVSLIDSLPASPETPGGRSTPQCHALSPFQPASSTESRVATRPEESAVGRPQGFEPSQNPLPLTRVATGDWLDAPMGFWSDSEVPAALSGSGSKEPFLSDAVARRTPKRPRGGLNRRIRCQPGKAGPAAA